MEFVPGKCRSHRMQTLMQTLPSITLEITCGLSRCKLTAYAWPIDHLLFYFSERSVDVAAKGRDHIPARRHLVNATVPSVFCIWFFSYPSRIPHSVCRWSPASHSDQANQMLHPFPILLRGNIAPNTFETRSEVLWREIFLIVRSFCYRPTNDFTEHLPNI